MKKSFFTAFLFLCGLICVNAQDLIVLKDGNMIEAKVTEISQTEIRYKRFDNLEGPTIVIPTASILSIRYENGTSEIFNPIIDNGQVNAQNRRPSNTAMDRDKFIVGFNANAGGALSYIWEGSGFSFNFEFGKGNFNSEVNLMFPISGFGFLITFNGFWPSQIGGAYFGGGIGWTVYDNYWFCNGMSFPVGLNSGYKFVTKSGVYFRTGVFVGFDFCSLWYSFVHQFYIKPDLAIGWTMR